MGRIALGVIVGYMAMVVWVMATLSLAWKLVGPDFAFRPGSTEVTAGWLSINIPLSFVGAYIGGSFALRMGREYGPVAVRALAGIVVVVGLVTAFVQLSNPPETAPPPEGTSAMHAASRAVQPTWYTFVIPFVGAAGNLLGGRRRAQPS